MAAKVQPRAFVVPAGPANGYGTIRSLAEAGIRVLALDHRKIPVRKSRYCDFRVIPDPDKDTIGFVDAVRNLAASESVPPLVVATQDLHVHVLHKHASRMRPMIRFPFMSSKALEASIDKRCMLVQAKASGLHIPETWMPGDVVALKKLLPKLCRYPYLVKPASKFELLKKNCYWNFAFYESFGVKALRATTPEQLQSIFAEAASRGFRLLVQEEIPGSADKLVAVDFYADAGHDLTAWHTGHKMRQWPSDYGTCTLGRSSPIPEIAKMAQRFVSHINFHGIGNIEFKLHRGIPYFLEINPRPWMWIWMASLAGVNLPLTAYQDLNHGFATSRTTQYRKAKWVDLRMDVHHLKELGPLAWARPLFPVHGDARFSMRDPLPVIDALANAFLRRMSHAWRREEQISQAIEPIRSAEKAGMVP